MYEMVLFSFTAICWLVWVKEKNLVQLFLSCPWKFQHKIFCLSKKYFFPKRTSSLFPFFGWKPKSSKQSCEITAPSAIKGIICLNSPFLPHCLPLLLLLLLLPFLSPPNPRNSGSQRAVVYLGWPIAPSYMSPNAEEGGWVRGLSQGVRYSSHRSPNKLWRYNSVLNL